MSTDSRTRPTDDDEGKDVLDATGEDIGIVAAVEEGVVHVETDPGITDEILARLGWGDSEDTHTVRENEIERITEDAVRLQSTEPGQPGDADAPGTGTPTEPSEPGEPGGERTDETTSEGMASDPDEEPSTGEAATRGAEEENPDLGSEEEPTDPGTEGRETGVGAEEHPESGAGAPGTMDSSRPDEGPPAEDVGDADRRRGSEDVADPAPEEPRGSEDVADPAPEEPRDTEDVRERTDELSEDDRDDRDENRT